MCYGRTYYAVTNGKGKTGVAVSQQGAMRMWVQWLIPEPDVHKVVAELNRMETNEEKYDDKTIIGSKMALVIYEPLGYNDWKDVKYLNDI